jgi:two-component system, NtrC family, response regulator AtoC
MPATILIVDDEKHTRDGLRLSLEEEFDVYVAADKSEALEVLRHDHVDVMVTDLRLGADDGMQVIDAALTMPKPPICIMMTAYGSVSTAVEAMKRGAYHFVTKPLNIDELEIVIKRSLKTRGLEQENASLKRQVSDRYSLDRLIGQSAAMQHIFETIEQVAPSRATVLIEGESGTGKELAAHAIHHLSGRPKDKLVIVHCAALSPQLLESELFGHERGAFTGALERRIGRFEQANGGTLVLDEMGEIDASIQVKLLRALGERTIERVGGNTPIKIDVRVVAATNKDLEAMVAAGTFREDLYYRLNVVRLLLPPLRERKEDLLALTQHFLKELAKENGKPARELSSEAMQAIMDYDWPGNVRELRAALERAVVMSTGTKITVRHFPESLRGGAAGPVFKKSPSPRLRVTDEIPPTPPSSVLALPGPDQLNLANMERLLIRRALQKTGQNRTEAATLLGISRRTLQRKLAELGEVRGRSAASHDLSAEESEA